MTVAKYCHTVRPRMEERRRRKGRGGGSHWSERLEVHNADVVTHDVLEVGLRDGGGAVLSSLPASNGELDDTHRMDLRTSARPFESYHGDCRLICRLQVLSV